MKQQIYLTGFMGTGKSTVGFLLARRLHLPFVDLDAVIERAFGMSISMIFQKEGEALFRRAEHEALLHLSTLIPCVVSLGGGAILSESNREILKRGFWVNLTASPAVIDKRVGRQSHRPLLGSRVSREKIEELLRKRRPYYDLAPHQIETDGLTPEAVERKILKVIPPLNYSCYVAKAASQSSIRGG